mgnify:CR=1 FL=1
MTLKGKRRSITITQFGEEIKTIPRRKIVMKEESCKASKKMMIRRGNEAEKREKYLLPKIFTSTELKTIQ